MFSPRPKPTREALALEVLILDERLQMRDLGGALYDADAAQEYAARMEEGDTFPPVEVVREKRRGKQPALWVFSGFTRVGAYTLRGAASVECLVYEGTFDDALFYALSENRKHGQASRPGDKAKAVATLLDSPNLMARVREAARERDMRAVIALACGVGESTVTHELNRRGVRIQGTKLLPKEPQSDKSLNERQPTDIKAPVQSSLPAPAPAEPPSAEPADTGLVGLVEGGSGAASQTVSGSSAPDSSAPTAPAGAPAKPKAPPAVPRSEGAIIADLLSDVCRRLDEYATTADGRWLVQSSSGVIPEAMRELADELTEGREPSADPTPVQEFVARMNAACRALDAVKKTVTGLCAAAPFGRQIHRDSVVNAIEQARKALWQSRPTEVCNCTAGGAPPKPECRACFGTGASPACLARKGGK